MRSGIPASESRREAAPPTLILDARALGLGAGLALLVILNVAFFNRYRRGFGIDSRHVLEFLLIFNASYLVLLLSTAVYGDVINPLSLYTVFTFSYAFSRLPLSGIQTTGSLKTQIVILLSALSYSLGAWLHRRRELPATEGRAQPASRPMALLVLVGLSLLAFILETLQLGYLPVLAFFDDRNVYEEAGASAIPFVHYLVLLATTLPSLAYVYYRRGAIQKRTMVITFAVAGFITVNSLSRQGLLFFSVTTFLTFNFYFHFSFAKKAAFGVLFGVIFLVVGALRLSQLSDSSHVDYLASFGAIEYETNLAEGWLVSYASLPFSRLDELVSEHTAQSGLHYGKYLLRPLAGLFFLEKLRVLEYEPDTHKAVLTYVADPYLDLSFPG